MNHNQPNPRQAVGQLTGKATGHVPAISNQATTATGKKTTIAMRTIGGITTIAEGTTIAKIITIVATMTTITMTTIVGTTTATIITTPTPTDSTCGATKGSPDNRTTGLKTYAKIEADLPTTTIRGDATHGPTHHDR